MLKRVIVPKSINIVRAPVCHFLTLPCSTPFIPHQLRKTSKLSKTMMMNLLCFRVFYEYIKDIGIDPILIKNRIVSIFTLNA